MLLVLTYSIIGKPSIHTVPLATHAHDLQVPVLLVLLLLVQLLLLPLKLSLSTPSWTLSLQRPHRKDVSSKHCTALTIHNDTMAIIIVHSVGTFRLQIGIFRL